MSYDVGMKLFMRYGKDVLVHMANQYGICPDGSKKDLAKRIAQEEDKRFDEKWRKIIKPHEIY
ncbi:MAG: hypothetical protein AB1401_00350 [Thermodesulfobacteriota bacterium]